MKKDELSVFIRFSVNMVMLMMSLFSWMMSLYNICIDCNGESVYYMIFDTFVLVFCLIYTKHTFKMILRYV